MHKIVLLSLSVCSSTFPMLGPVIRSAVRSRTVAGGSVLNVHCHEQSMQRRTVSGRASRGDEATMPSLGEFIDQVKTEAKKMDPHFLAQLKYKESDLNEYSSRWESEDAFSRKLRYIAANAVLFGPSDDDMVSAVCAGDAELVKHLLSYGGNPNASSKWVGMHTSVLDKAIYRKNKEIMQLLLDAKACSYDTDYLIKLNSGDLRWVLSYPQQQGAFRFGHDSIRKIIEDEARFCFQHSYFTQTLSQELCVEVLKKIMLAVRAGAEYNFSFWTGGFDGGRVVELGEDMRTMYLSQLKDDWTRGKFTALADYFRHLITCDSKKASSYEKETAQAAIRGIMYMYGITEADLDITSKVPVASSRVQE